MGWRCITLSLCVCGCVSVGESLPPWISSQIPRNDVVDISANAADESPVSALILKPIGAPSLQYLSDQTDEFTPYEWWRILWS